MADDEWIWQREWTIPSETAAARHLLDEILSELRARDWAPRDVFAVHLAIHEALVNAITHGNDQNVDKTVAVACRIAVDRIRVEISDEGGGFDPNRVPDPTGPNRVTVPGGRGVLLMKAFMSRVEFSPPGNRVVMEKRRS